MAILHGKPLHIIIKSKEEAIKSKDDQMRMGQFLSYLFNSKLVTAQATVKGQALRGRRSVLVGLGARSMTCSIKSINRPGHAMNEPGFSTKPSKLNRITLEHACSNPLGGLKPTSGLLAPLNKLLLFALLCTRDTGYVDIKRLEGHFIHGVNG